MTPQEALTELKASIEGCGFQCHMETYKMAISALERLIPKKVVVEGITKDVTCCPNCTEVVDGAFCPTCEQALDFSENETT